MTMKSNHGDLTIGAEKLTEDTFSPIVTPLEIEKGLATSESAITGISSPSPSSQETYDYEWFDALLLLKVCGTSALLPLVQIAIPLGSGNKINPIAFIVYQMLYSCWGTATIRLSYSIVIPMIPRTLNIVAFVCNLLAQFITSLTFVLSANGTGKVMDLTRGLGITVYAFVSILGLLIFTVEQDRILAASSTADGGGSTPTVHSNRGIGDPVAFCSRPETAEEARHNDSIYNSSSATTASTIEQQGGDRLSSVGNRNSIREERNSSIMRFIDLAASVDQPSFVAARLGQLQPVESQMLLLSCAAKNSLWRNVIPWKQTTSTQLSHSTGYDLPVLKLTALSIIMYDSYPGELDFKLIGSATAQWLRGLVRDISSYSLFLFCQWMAVENSDIRAAIGEVGYYLLFLAGLAVLRVCFQIVGLWIDLHKTGGPSEQQLLDMWISMYYFVFYRGLFISVQSYSVFAVIKVLHIAQELCSYQLRYTEIYAYYFQCAYDYVHSQQQQQQQQHQTQQKQQREQQLFGVFKSLAAVALGPPLVVQLQRTDIILGLRLYLVVYTSTVFIVSFSFLRFGYNRHFYCLFESIGEAQYQRVMIFTAISMVLEILLFIYINSYSRRRRGSSALAAWQRFLTGHLATPWSVPLVLLVVATASAVVNLNLAQLDLSSLGDHSIECF